MAHLVRKIQVALTPRSWQLRTTLNNGAKVAGYNRAGWGGRGVFIYRDGLEPELAIIDKLLKPGDVFVDVGANVGVFSMKAAKAVGETGLVVSVEPFLGSAQQILKNVQLNRFNNVRVRNVCMGSTTGAVQFYLNNEHPNAFALTPIGDAQAISVLGVALDDLVRWEDLARLDYLKIDAEGAEKLVLDGGADSIARFRPIIQVETSIGAVNLPQGYVGFKAKPELENPDLPADNQVFIPVHKPDVMKTVAELGWLPV